MFEETNMTDCMYCELTIHGGCLRGDCTCECKGDRNKFITEDYLSDKRDEGTTNYPMFST